jgi:hypothetical protein
VLFWRVISRRRNLRRHAGFSLRLFRTLYREAPSMRKTEFLFLIILIEGYVVLSCELLAIRQLVPFVGSGTEIVAIIISGVLLPLALGYHFGGNAYQRSDLNTAPPPLPTPSIRRILLRNLLIALGILSVGLSSLFLHLYFDLLIFLGVSNRLCQAASYALLFLVVPVFLLGQTVPLTSNYFSKQRLSAITGKMLFFSTAGSFLGSIFSTIVLMSTIGVHNTVIVTLALLALLCILLSGKRLHTHVIVAVGLLALVFALNNNWIMRLFGIVSDDAYNTIRVEEMPEQKGLDFVVNNSSASRLAKDPKNSFAYVRYLEDKFIYPLVDLGEPARDILIVGAGGFTMGFNDTLSNYTFVDIDPNIREVAEKDFLHRPLSPNKKFLAVSARGFLQHADRKYDLIILDTYTNRHAIPMECTTREYLQQVKALLKVNGILAANIVSSANFSDAFTVRYDRTFAGVLSPHTRQIIGDYNPWDQTPGNNNVNVIYTYVNNPLAKDIGIYTDDKNTYSSDRP